jgi:hypothetical protein
MKVLIFSVAILLAGNVFAQSKSAVVGEWEGESVCQVPKPCTTEHVIYDIKQDASGQLTTKADKVVNGDREWMGTLNCTWVAPKLSCPLTNVSRPGDWVFVLEGDTLRGTLTLRDTRMIFRKITVTRKK